jgi:superfamily II DNA or RNA helicase
MLKEVDWSESRDYRSDTEHEPIEFYLNGLANSNRLDLLLGYFSFSAINVLALGFTKFLANGGKMRVIANNILAPKDKEAIMQASEPDFEGLIDLTDIRGLNYLLNDYGKHFFECMAWLIREKRIEIVLVKPKDRKGISHFKSGVFYDENTKVAFTASSNFTAYGMLENSEEVSTFLKWENSRSSKKIEAQEQYFETIFSGDADFVEYIPVEEAINAVLEEFGGKTLEELELSQSRLAVLKQTKTRNSRLQKVLSTLEKESTDESVASPRFPFPSGPREYQKEAYEVWVKNNRKGLFAMATGTGKTITSLNCVLEDYKLHGFYRFLVLVPSLPLASQWKKEAADKFGFHDVIICSSKNSTWEDELRTKGKSLAFGNDTNFCVIATYSTFKGVRFQSAFFGVIGKQLDSVTLIADEAHTMGSGGMLRSLPHKIEKRIGLSATPDRVYDAHGTNELERFFDAYPPKYTFRYTMKEAIEKEVLCRYNYHPIFFELTQNELEVYQNYTERLRKHIDPKTGKYKDNSVVNNLLIQRKNVIHKAKNKLPKLQQIINEIGSERFKYGFIYVPEGYEPDYETIDDFDLSDGDAHIIDLYTQFLYKNFKFSLKSFTGETKNRDQILDLFSMGKYDAVLAMKCLDEGVDVPRAEYAIFCASTGNPRQFVQRRGRVLRTHKDKEMATIYDLIAAPLFDKFQLEDNDQLETEKNIFRTELRRVINFAALADNCSELLKGELLDVCRRLELDLTEAILTELKTYD